ncbi:MAG TPA: glycoside hydrolase family 127 protein [Phycisphaerae bacterium]|nr:glycoside hydrolase family 127 protein [Phycisphaerae bacterium]HOJ54016.1 glycoside hydrolase family 127 protein [Phycisphaerae bacterium]HOL26427.1 glycoside hydrolase family 127 protein [Phycisphaerae bacterium]HPP20406.1 glycoside hydrolase family 127 protein [Phycisphaerae bacterium]HPU32873.1 glycoside hydrolase family 127 protein [Phycisphaerae bacterium]
MTLLLLWLHSAFTQNAAKPETPAPSASGASEVNSQREPPRPVPPGDVRMTGELAIRLKASFDRLEQEDHHPPTLFDKPNEGWPGDREGRTLLGLIYLSQVTGREAQHLKAILDEYPRRVNARGYLGPIIAPEAISEQALGGQFWLLRAFHEYAAWRQDTRVLAWADRLLAGVYLAAAGSFKHYPLDPAVRQAGEYVYGREVGQSGKWILSSDVGCGLAGSLDGLTEAYARKPSPEVHAAIEEAASRFLQMDLEAVHAQLHSTLISTRALLRHYETTGRKELLQAARDRYHLYRGRAMTDTFENHNWFGRPEWTEGCAVVDSFIVAVQLWRFTGDVRYLEDAHLIYYNGLCVNQRSNGGFGCDSCPSRDHPFLTIKTQEAHWCCTQRGADGLARAAQYCFFTDQEGVIIPFYQDGEAVLRWDGRMMKLRVTTEYPWRGRVRIEVLASKGDVPRVMRLFVPSWANAPAVTVNGQPAEAMHRQGFAHLSRRWQAGDVVELAFGQNVVAKPPINQVNGAAKGPYHTFHYGALILGHSGPEHVRIPATAAITRQSDREFNVEGRRLILRPIYHLLDPAVSQDQGYRRQVLFE